eukprot:scaffold63441_cov31-Tisochrysis_lutea.AAC.1
MTSTATSAATRWRACTPGGTRAARSCHTAPSACHTLVAAAAAAPAAAGGSLRRGCSLAGRSAMSSPASRATLYLPVGSLKLSTSPSFPLSSGRELRPTTRTR